MNDLISLNRQFLVMARAAALASSGEIITGLPRSVLDRLAEMSLEDIEAVAQGASVSLITLRLSRADMERFVSLRGAQQTAYSLATVAAGAK